MPLFVLQIMEDFCTFKSEYMYFPL
jgi:hypothetical protein